MNVVLHSTIPPAGRYHRGVTLIEVLVAVLIVAFGIVALLVLQANTLKYQRGSSQRAQLSVLLSDYVERVRANLDQAPGVVNNSPYLISANWNTQSAIPSAAVDCTSDSCSAAQLAAFDMAQWRTAVRQALPRGSVFVQGTAARGMTVAFMWTDKELAGAGGTLGATAAANAANGESVMAQTTRCPANAAVPAGVRCAVFVVAP